jgi:Tol biopolymer transport system component
LGEDVTSTLARVLEVGANFSALPTGVPPAARRTLELCLEKDARKRIADMRDVRLALAGTFATTAPALPSSRLALPVAAAVAIAALLAGTVVWVLKPAPPAEPKIVTRFNYALPAGVSFRAPVTSVLDIAPGGEFFAFNSTDGIYVRKMGEVEAHVIPGTNGTVADVVISPDGREVAYFRNGPAQLIKVAIGGGAPVVLVDPIRGLPFGLSWEPDGTLYYGQPNGIWRVSHNGGTPEQVVKTEGGQTAYGPQLLPGGEWLLFTLAKTIGASRWNDADIVVQSLKSGERRVLRSGGFDARYLRSGHITYAFQNTLFASAFDANTLKLDDERVAVVQGVQSAITSPLGGSAFYAVSNNGTLVFVPGTAGTSALRPQRSLVWVDREGKTQPLPLRPDNYTMARLSPDGTRIALVVGSTLPASDPPPDIYVYDLKTENLTQLTFNPQADDAPVWSRDGSRIFYRAYKDGVGAVTAVSADGGTPELLARSESGDHPLVWSISPDGETLLLVNAATLQDVNLGMLGVGTDKVVKPLLDLTEQVAEPSLSPNGQWLLYYEYRDVGAADAEVDIRPFPDVRQQRRPVGPGVHPVFSADGAEIFVFDGAGLSVVPVQSSPFRVGSPRKLFRGQFWYGVAGPTGALGRAWDVDSKNDRFLMITMPAADSSGAPAQAEIDVVINWLEELRQRVPKH